MKQIRLIILLFLCLATGGCSVFTPSRQRLSGELITAARNVDCDALQSALNRGADPDTGVDSNGTVLGTLLRQYKKSHRERRCRIEKCVLLLLEHNADPERLHRGFTPLQIAAGQGSDVLVSQLIRFGADPSAETRAGLAPLWQAVYTNDNRLSLELLQAGANPNARNTEGQTPMEYLRACGYTKNRIMLQLRHYGGH